MIVYRRRWDDRRVRPAAACEHERCGAFGARAEDRTATFVQRCELCEGHDGPHRHQWETDQLTHQI